MLVTNETAVLNAIPGSTGPRPRLSGSSACSRCSRYSSDDGQEGEGEQGGGVAGPALLGVRVDPHHPVHRALHPPVPLGRCTPGPGSCRTARTPRPGRPAAARAAAARPWWRTSELLRSDQRDEQVDDQRQGEHRRRSRSARSQPLQPPQRQRQHDEPADQQQGIGQVGHHVLLHRGHPGRDRASMRSRPARGPESSRLPNGAVPRIMRGGSPARGHDALPSARQQRRGAHGHRLIVRGPWRPRSTPSPRACAGEPAVNQLADSPTDRPVGRHHRRRTRHA